MNIVFIVDTLNSGGKERRLVELIRVLSTRRVYVPILILTEGVNAKQSVDYKDILKKDIKIYYLGNLNRLNLSMEIFKICKNDKIDIIHNWAPILTTYLIYPSKLLLKIVILNSSLTSARKVSSWLQFLKIKITYLMSDKILSNSYQALKVYNVPEDKGLVIYNGFNQDRVKNLINKNLIREKFGIKSKYIVTMAAEYSYRKDYPTYVEAANIVLKKGYDITFLSMGSGDFTPYYSLVVTKFKNNVKFLNRQADVESIINASDIGVLASRVEGLPNFVLECMALAKPVVANFGEETGTQELITDSEHGYLVEVENPESLADKIIRLIENEELRYNMGISGQNIVKSKFSIENMVNSFSELYGNYKNKQHDSYN